VIAYPFLRSREDASGILYLLPFLLVAAGIAWVVGERSPQSLGEVGGALSQALYAYWDYWPIALLLFARVER
jgi:hypothetical protein